MVKMRIVKNTRRFVLPGKKPKHTVLYNCEKAKKAFLRTPNAQTKAAFEAALKELMNLDAGLAIPIQKEVRQKTGWR
jgi:hypothetical protein